MKQAYITVRHNTREYHVFSADGVDWHFSWDNNLGKSLFSGPYDSVDKAIQAIESGRRKRYCHDPRIPKTLTFNDEQLKFLKRAVGSFIGNYARSGTSRDHKLEDLMEETRKVIDKLVPLEE